MSIVRNRKSFSSPSLQALIPPPIPTGKGSRSAANPAFSKYIDETKEIPELILPDYFHRSDPEEINYYELILQGDEDSVNRLLRSAADYGFFQLSGHGIISSFSEEEELKSTLLENQWVFQLLGKSKWHCSNHEEVVWLPEIAEKSAANNSFGGGNLHVFGQTMKKVARKLEEIAQELAPIIGNGEIQTSKSTLVLHRYHQTTPVTDHQLPSSNNDPTNEEGEQISSKYTLSLHLLLEPGLFFSRDHEEQEEGFSVFTRRNIVIVTLGDDAEGQRTGEFKPEVLDSGPLFSIELKYYSSSSDINALDLSNSSPKKFSLGDQMLILLLLVFLYKAYCFFFS